MQKLHEYTSELSGLTYVFKHPWLEDLRIHRADYWQFESRWWQKYRARIGD